MKKQYFLVLDVETANNLTDGLVYDIGCVITDRHGKIYEQFSAVVTDIFYGFADIMQTAYYANKIPQYIEAIDNNEIATLSFFECRKAIANLIKKYHIEQVFAYNAHFDISALNTTEQYITKSACRHFLPYGMQVCCIWHMACQLICTQKKYHKYCVENRAISPAGNIRTNAETVYGYLTKNSQFQECHTGLQDTLIETAILAKCFSLHKKVDMSINRRCWLIPQKQK